MSLRKMQRYISDGFVLSWIVILIFFLLSTSSIEKSDHDIISSTRPTVTVYLCPQYPSASKGYFRVHFKDNFPVDYTKVCKSDDILLVYILSKIDHIDRRERIRRTWANKNEYEQLLRTCFIFLIGLNDNVSLNAQIISEALLYGDIVQLNLTESYKNIVYKEVGGLKWSHIYASHIPYLFKTDDDMIVDSLLLSDIARFFIENRTDHNNYFRKHGKMHEFIRDMAAVDRYTLFRGSYIEGQKTIRKGKFGLHHVAWNHDRLPGYCSGMGYMFSSFVRDRLYRASLCYALEYVPWMGDLFVSGAVASAAAVQCSPWIMEYAQTAEGCASQFQTQPRLLLCSTPMHMGRLYMEDYDQTWTVILHRHSLTNETIQNAKKKRIILLKEQEEEKLLMKKSIIEQMEENALPLGGAIVPLSQREENLD